MHGCIAQAVLCRRSGFQRLWFLPHGLARLGRLALDLFRVEFSRIARLELFKLGLLDIFLYVNEEGIRSGDGEFMIIARSALAEIKAALAEIEPTKSQWSGIR